MKKIKILFFLLIFACSIFVFFESAFAQSLWQARDNFTENAGVNLTNTPKSFSGMVTTVITTISGLMGTIFFLLILYASILWLTAYGQEDKVGKAKKIITDSIIGLAIALSAFAITSYVGSQLGGSASSPAVDCVGQGGTCKPGGAGLTPCNDINFSGEISGNKLCSTNEVCCRNK